MHELEFLYDLATPNCYVAHAKLKRICSEKNLELKFSPLFLGGLFKLANDAPVPKQSLDYRYMEKSLGRISKNLGITFQIPA